MAITLNYLIILVVSQVCFPSHNRIHEQATSLLQLFPDKPPAVKLALLATKVCEKFCHFLTDFAWVWVLQILKCSFLSGSQNSKDPKDSWRLTSIYPKKQLTQPRAQGLPHNAVTLSESPTPGSKSARCLQLSGPSNPEGGPLGPRSLGPSPFPVSYTHLRAHETS